MKDRGTAAALPLTGIRVLEFCHTIMGPSAGLILADLGADVIKVEPANGDPTRRRIGFAAGFFATFNRNKRSFAVDLKNEEGRRPVYGGTQKFQQDPHWRDYLLFYEYFHGDNGAGLGASHQTGWTGIIARAMHLFATTTPEQVLQLGKMAAVVEVQKSRSDQSVTAGGQAR